MDEAEKENGEAIISLGKPRPRGATWKSRKNIDAKDRDYLVVVCLL